MSLWGLRFGHRCRLARRGQGCVLGAGRRALLCPHPSAALDPCPGAGPGRPAPHPATHLPRPPRWPGQHSGPVTPPAFPAPQPQQRGRCPRPEVGAEGGAGWRGARGAIVSVITGPPAHIPTLPSDEPAPRAPRPSSQPREPAPDAPRRTGPQAPGLALGGSPPDFLLLITGATGPVVTVTTARAPARGAVETRPAHAAPRKGLAVASLCRAQGWHRASALGALGGGSLGAASGGAVRRGVSPAPPHPSRATPTPVGRTWLPARPSSEATRSTGEPGSRLGPWGRQEAPESVGPQGGAGEWRAASAGGGAGVLVALPLASS